MGMLFSFLRDMVNIKAFFMLTGQAGDRREKALVDHVVQTTERGNPQSVLEAIDSYGTHTNWLMNIGDNKGPFLDSAIAKYNPRVALEIGMYCGYSAVRIASQLQKPGSMLVAVETSPLNCQIATQIIDHAGNQETIEFISWLQVHIRNGETWPAPLKKVSAFVRNPICDGRNWEQATGFWSKS